MRIFLGVGCLMVLFSSAGTQAAPALRTPRKYSSYCSLLNQEVEQTLEVFKKAAPSLRDEVDQEKLRIQAAYDRTIKKFPNDPECLVGLGIFLEGIGRPQEAKIPWERAAQMAPNDAHALNTLATSYVQRGAKHLAFRFFQRAIDLNPSEPIYVWNLATAVFSAPKDAQAYFHLTEAEVFDKALALYETAFRLAPSFELASDWAMAYAGATPLRPEEAIRAWSFALEEAPNELERQRVYLQQARYLVLSGKFDLAEAKIKQVEMADLDSLKGRIRRLLERKKSTIPTATDLAGVLREGESLSLYPAPTR